MVYKISWNKDAILDTVRIPRNVALSIYNKIENYLAQEPRKNGKPLKLELKGLWAAKHARYRIIYEILEPEKTVVIIEIGKRSTIYD